MEILTSSLGTMLSPLHEIFSLQEGRGAAAGVRLDIYTRSVLSPLLGHEIQVKLDIIEGPLVRLCYSILDSCLASSNVKSEKRVGLGFETTFCVTTFYGCHDLC